MTLSPQWLDELRGRIALSTVVGRSVPLKKAGREWKACCPFHNEKTPSFWVNDDKGFYHCFGCGAHGDAIRWMTDQRGLPFIDAVKELAAEAGMTMPAPDPRAAQRAEKQADLHDVMAAAAEWFTMRLHDDGGREARAYLERRGITADTAKRFGFGFSPDSRGALKEALNSFGEAMLVEAGLLIKVDDKEPYDRFRGRLMIPIRDPRGRVIAFGGRIIGQGEPKYLNSPETPLFDKGRTLYNLDFAAPAARRADRVLVVEGYMDAIAIAQAGIGEAVAPLGTALTEHQIERLWRIVPAPLLCFDGDKAGQKAAMRAATRALPLLRPGHTLRFLVLPQGLDPDDLIRQQGVSALLALIEKPVSLAEIVWRGEVDAGPLDSPEDKAGLKARLFEHVEAITNRDVATFYRQEWLDRFSARFFPPRAPRPSPSPARGAVRNGQRGNFRFEAPAPASDDARKIKGDTVDALWAAILDGLLRHPAVIARQAEALARCQPPDGMPAKTLDALLALEAEAEALDRSQLATILRRQGLSDAVSPNGLRFTFNREVVRDGDDEPDQARPIRDLEEAIAMMAARPAIEAALAQATRRFEGALEERYFEEQQRLRERKLEFDRRLMQLADGFETG